LQRTHCTCILAAATCSDNIAPAFWLLQLAATTLHLHFGCCNLQRQSFSHTLDFSEVFSFY
jgi:hypothetical protein